MEKNNSQEEVIQTGPAFVEVTDPMEKEQSEGRTKKLRHLTEYPLNIDTIII